MLCTSSYHPEIPNLSNPTQPIHLRIHFKWRTLTIFTRWSRILIPKKRKALDTGQWSICRDESDWAFLVHTITKPEKLFFRATATNWEAFWAFSFASTPPLRRDALGLRVLLSDFTNVCNIPNNVYTGQSTEMKLIFLFPTYFSLGRGLGCGVYLDAGSTRDPRTSLESFQMISKYRDATKPRVLLLDVTNFQYTRNIPYCFNNVLEEHSKLCGLMHCVNFLHFQSSVPLRKYSEIIGTRNCAFVDKPEVEDW